MKSSVILSYFLIVIVFSEGFVSAGNVPVVVKTPIGGKNSVDGSNLPAFDLRDVDGVNYISTIKNYRIPNYCNSGWAVAVTSAITDRMRFLTRATWPITDLAYQVIVNCDEGSYGCSGGTALSAYRYIYDHGIPEETCMPYTGVEERCEGKNICRRCDETGACIAVASYRKYYLEEYNQVSGVKAMMMEIYNRGTITCTIRANDAFDGYRGGILQDDGGIRYTHTLSVIGWGIEEDQPYWIVRNSWGSHWGESGYARILRGVNAYGIEEDCHYAVPEMSFMKSDDKVVVPFTSCGYPTDWIANPPKIQSPLPHTYINVSSLPANFDIRSINGKNYATPNKNQHAPQYCNSCWAQAASSAIADRLMILRKGVWPMIEVSSQAVINCASDDCNGGDAASVYRLGYYKGIPDKSCQAYEGRKKECNSMGICMDCVRYSTCYAVENYRHIYVAEYGEVTGIIPMKAEIYARGPITCFMVMTDEFIRYTDGIFVEHDHVYKGGHIVEVAGWGKTPSGSEYWIVRNNWGDNWGEHGWFRIQMGGSNLMIETSCSWAVPNSNL